MILPKKEAALQAAIEYSHDARKAINEYARLTDQLGECEELSDYKRKILSKEMLKQLKPYRYPANDIIEEGRIFRNPKTAGLKVSGTATVYPNFLAHIQDVVDIEVYREIKEYVEQAENIKLLYNDGAKDIEKLRKAEKVYIDNLDKRSSERNTMIAQELGFSSGKKTSRFNKWNLYDYYYLYVRKAGATRRDAIKLLTEDYGLQSENATIKVLQDCRKENMKLAKEISPSIYEKMKCFLKGYIPYMIEMDDGMAG